MRPKKLMFREGFLEAPRDGEEVDPGVAVCV